MNHPKISIIVPIYNVESYLVKCINSIVNQTLHDIEIILVNDGSTDDSGIICDKFAYYDKRIKVIHKPNSGVSDSRNIGFQNVTAEYVMYLDSDDWIDKETCYDAYQQVKEGDYDLVFWGRVYEYPDKSVIQKIVFEKDTIFEGEDIKKLKLRMCGLVDSELIMPTRTDAFGASWGKLYKTSIIRDYNILFVEHNKVGSEDVLFNFMVFQKISSAKFLNKFYNHYRKDNPNSLTISHKSELFDRFLKLFELMENEIRANNLSEEYYQVFKNRVGLSIINLSISITSPNNGLSVFYQIKKIKNILTNPIYKDAISSLSVVYMPYYWRIFFLICKYRFAAGVYILAKVMRYLRKIIL